MKDLFSEFFERFISRMNQQAPIEEEYETETFEVSKGNCKTTITITFNKSGFPVGRNISTEVIPDEKEDKLRSLDRELKKALKIEDYTKAAEIKREMDSLKPTRTN